VASAAILVGGRASRLGGRDKGAIVVGGRTILDRQLGQLQQLTDDILLVGGDPANQFQGVRVVPDRVRDSGPLGGLDAALAAARDDTVVLLACDMPFVSAPFLAHLLTLAQNRDAVVPRTERGYHPLCAAYARACQPAIARRLAERRLKMLEFLEDVHVHAVDWDDIARFGDAERLLTNVNTPDELHDLEALLGHEL
jgi:molybdopterin-guanine dinucleotide biosynthesis protein A